jgi:hypothetical protein
MIKRNSEWFVVLYLIVFFVILWYLQGFAIKTPSEITSTESLSISTPTSLVSFMAVAKDDLYCIFSNRVNGSSVYIPQYQTIGVVGRDNTSGWALITTEFTTDCWVKFSLLDFDGEVASLPIIAFSPPSLPPTKTSTPPLSDPPELPLQVVVDVKTIECACDHTSGTSVISLTILNGVSPYRINGLDNVNSNKVEFTITSGTKVLLSVISSDNKMWEGIVTTPYCSSSQCEQIGASGSCEEIQVCEDTVIQTEVCVKMSASQNCLEWKEQEEVVTACHAEVICK